MWAGASGWGSIVSGGNRAERRRQKAPAAEILAAAQHREAGRLDKAEALCRKSPQKDTRRYRRLAPAWHRRARARAPGAVDPTASTGRRARSGVRLCARQSRQRLPCSRPSGGSSGQLSPGNRATAGLCARPHSSRPAALRTGRFCCRARKLPKGDRARPSRRRQTSTIWAMCTGRWANWNKPKRCCAGRYSSNPKTRTSLSISASC